VEAGLKDHSATTETETHGIETSSDDSQPIHEDKLSRDLTSSHAYNQRRKVAIVQGMNRPFFHIDLTSALQSAVANSSNEIPHV
jgi:sodium-independent sulfate anion transporter 11